MQNIPTPTTRTVARPSGETTQITEWNLGAYTLRKFENGDYTVWTVRTSGRGIPRVEDVAGIGLTPDFGVSCYSNGDLSPLDALKLAEQITEAAHIAATFNQIAAN